MLLIFAFSFINTTAYSQEIKQNSSDTIPIIKKDTLLNLKANDTLKSKQLDSLALKPKDSIKKPAELLESIIDHSADSLIRQDILNNKITLYDNAYIKYGDIELTAGYIEIDNNTSSVTAKGIKDSVGVYSQLPVFKQGGQESTQDTIIFNFKSEKAKIWNLKTEQQGIIILGEVSKKHNDSVVFIENIRLTTSDKENPDYYIKIKKAKFIKDKKLVASSSQLVLADVPTPVVVPFAYIPLTKGRTSGFLMPTWGENNNQGYFLQNGGYYFVLNDNFDLALLGDIYTNGSWGMRAESSYAKRYKYSGNFNFQYENLINSLKGLDDYSKATNYNIRWSHSQDSKASPNSRFSASVNMGSSQYFKQSNNEYNTNAFLNNNLSSSISYYKNFVGTPFNVSLSMTHSQNTNTEEITMTLPSLQLNMDRIYPFTGKNGAKNNAIQKTGLTYSMKGDNRINTTDEFFFKKEMFDDAKSGFQHNLTMNTNMKALKYFTISPSITYKDVWYFDRLKKTFDDVEDAVVTDTISSFSRFNEYSTSVSLGTTFYGMFKFKKGKLEAIRHVVRPSISYSYRPDFSDTYYEKVQQSAANPEEFLEYSPFSNGIYGGPSSGISNSLNFTLNNNLEAKLRKKDSTEGEAEKITLLNNLNFSTSYNMAADSLKWSPVGVNAGTKLFKDKLTLNVNATLDPYALDINGKRINTFNYNNGGSLFRLTNAGLTLNYSLESKKEKSGGSKPGGGQSEKEAANNSDGVFGESLTTTNQPNTDSNNSSTKETELYGSKIPWTLKIAYALNYSNATRQKEISSNSLMFSGDIELTPKWGVGFSSGYDIKNQGFTYTQLRFSRDLDSWKLNFNWVPFGDRQTYYFFIGVKSSMLSDLKYDKRKTPDKALF
ncbi:LPS-assembly protein LptD [Lutibacter sp. A64]|uniref:putative LPS assembly protein LptD n=1 Tax=Lutibacter sp. A64 TaxID=2918526 RepID=UPI001F05C7D0|nr:putative LPS assembly protein LptD [Lutibacter sp. A64]UMB53864.1 LPS-assembly protein LptD [Lutibacter sp. A64]